MSGICAMWRRGGAVPLGVALKIAVEGICSSKEESAALEADKMSGVAVAARFPTQQIYRSGEILIVCDADLSNERDLRNIAGGYEPCSLGAETAELLVALYRRMGSSFIEKLAGSFSIILWDGGEQRMISAIDGFGIGRLFYFQTPELFAVASRITALSRCPEFNDAIHPAGIADFLNFTASVAPRTVFANVQRLTPGTIVTAVNGQVRTTKYWDMHYGTGATGNEEELCRQLEASVEASVIARYKNDSPEHLGAFLSGGTDSSTVVGMMRRHTPKVVNTFSIGFQEQSFNELGYAQITAEKFKTAHHTHLVSPEQCFEALPEIVRSFDEPYGNSSAIPTYFCARLAAENGVKVLFAGDGGDELFGGNKRYLTDKVFSTYHRIPRSLRGVVIEPLINALPANIPIVTRGRNYIRRANLDPVERYFSYHFVCAHGVEQIFDEDFQAALDRYSVLSTPAEYYRSAAAHDHLDRLLYIDMKLTLADNDLPKVTSMSELAGIQTRFPFLDRGVAEFACSLPVNLKVKGTRKRYLFKQAFRNLLPEEVIRKKKHGFGIPVSTWLKSYPPLREYSRDVLFSSRALGRGYFKRGFIEKLCREHETDTSPYYGDTLWTLFMLELWHRQYVDCRKAVLA